MGIKKIVTISNKRLRARSEEVRQISPELREFIKDLIDTLHSKPGLGIAAPQIGKNIRVVVIESRGVTDEEGNVVYENIPLMVLINPEIIKYSKDKVEMEEGCFSVPNIFGPVIRPKKVKVIATNLDNKKVQINAAGLLARIIQHEIDHLNGVLFIDRVTDKATLKEVSNDREPSI